jgi:hypothetical protein
MVGTPSIGGGLTLPVCSPMGYQAVPASQAAQALGPAGGAVGDYLHGVLIVPATTAAGTVSIKDGSGSAINVFVNGGTLSDTRSWFLPLNLKSVSGAWQIGTGANVSVLAVGSFT